MKKIQGTIYNSTIQFTLWSGYFYYSCTKLLRKSYWSNIYSSKLLLDWVAPAFHKCITKLVIPNLLHTTALHGLHQ